MLSRVLLFVTAIFTLCFCIAETADAGELIVVANRSVPDDTLRSKDICNIYYGKRTRWSDGTSLIPVVRKPGKTQDSFISTVLHKSVGQYESFWKQALFTGEGTPPHAFATETDLLDYVENTPGALGFVENLPDSIRVKQLVIIE